MSSFKRPNKQRCGARRGLPGLYLILLLLITLGSASPVWTQEGILAFSTDISSGTDGFNNGDLSVSTGSEVPLVIGLFDKSGLEPMQINGSAELRLEILDTEGLPHELVTLDGEFTAHFDHGQSVTTALVRFDVAVPETEAIIRLSTPGRDFQATTLTISFEGEAVPDLRIVTRVVNDLNGNGLFDADEELVTRCSVFVYPGRLQFDALPGDDGEIIVELFDYEGPFPVRLFAANCPGFLQVRPPLGEGLIFDAPGEYAAEFYLQPAQTQSQREGLRTVLFNAELDEQPDSSFVLRSFDESTVILSDLTANRWRQSILFTPIAGEEAEAGFAMDIYAAFDDAPNALFARTLLDFGPGREIVTPDFSAIGAEQYSLEIYNRGQMIFSEDGRSGPAIELRRNLHTWQAGKDYLAVRLLLAAPVQVAGGNSVVGDSVVMKALDPGRSPNFLTLVAAKGDRIEAAQFAGRAISPFNCFSYATGSAELESRGSEEIEELVVRFSGAGGLVVDVEQAQTFQVNWLDLSADVQDDAAELSVSAEGFAGGEYVPDFGRVGLRRAGEALQLFADAAAYGTQPKQVQVFNNGVQQLAVEIAGDELATLSAWPIMSSIATVSSASFYAFGWENAVTFSFEGAGEVSGDEIRIGLVDTPAFINGISSFRISAAGISAIVIDDMDMPTPLVATMSIVIIGEVVDDNSGGPLSGREVRVFDSDNVLLASDVTGPFGEYGMNAFSTIPGPFRVEIEPVFGWLPVYPSTVAHYLNHYHFQDTTFDDTDFREVQPDGLRQQQSGFIGGADDDFSTDDGLESSAPGTAFADRLANCGNGLLDEFDILPADRCFGHSFDPVRPDTCPVVLEASLEIDLRAGSSVGSVDDVIALQKDGVTIWQAYLAQLTNEGTWLPGQGIDLRLDLADLPLAERGTTNLIAALQDGAVDLLVRDDSGVDFVNLSVTLGCEIDTDVKENDRLDGTAGFTLTSAPAPNPAKEWLRLEFALDRRESLTLTLNDALGRTIATLVEARLYRAGRHSTILPLPALPAGWYNLRIAGSEFAHNIQLLVRQ